MPTRVPQRFLITLFVAAALVAASGVAMATGGAAPGDRQPSLAGSYLAGRSADMAGDMATAVKFYNGALAADPDNPGLLERALLLSVASGDLEPAFGVAERLAALDDSNVAAGVTLAVRAIKQHKYEDARADLKKIAPVELATITAGMMEAWIDFGEGKVDDGLKTLEALSGPEWYGIFKEYHGAVMLDAAGRGEEAVAAIGKAYKQDAQALRIVDSYARILARNGKRDEAIRALEAFSGEAVSKAVISTLLNEIKSGKTPTPLVTTAEGGAAEALYGLGTAIGLDDGPELSAAYLRLSAFLEPNAHLTTIWIGNVFQGMRRCDDAIAEYEVVPPSDPLRRYADIQIGACLMFLDKPDEATAYLKRVVEADPKDTVAAVELGNAYRVSSRYTEAAEAYSKGVAEIGTPTKGDWAIFYFRGIALERAKRWPEAEADFKQALALNADQPDTLNYLGYSWVDKGMNLDEALAMIKKAVELRPNDGFIVDSLGWAYYRLDRLEEAVSEMEKAVALRPEDPTINDHLGDVYWSVGRKREARFQWAHARDLEPEKEDLPRILAKLQNGLTLNESDIAKTAAASVEVTQGESLWSIAKRVFGDGGQYERLIEANRERIRDPDMIYPGMTLDVPAQNN